MSWASQMPKELTVQPLPFVALTGLEIKHNAVHKEIWDNFNLRCNLKFRYKLLDGDHEYPKCKPKRPAEYNIPKGLFKASWLNKHLYLVPSLVIVFFDLDWDEPNWKEKQMECATKVELVRQSLSDRNTRIILILIQKHPNIPFDGDNSQARERYPALCAACSIKNNYLFLLHAEHVKGYIIKLEEEAFNEPTQTYHTLEIKSIKFKRDSLIKVNHQLLLVRLAIKIAFFNEMKFDTFKAIEYYKNAYISLLDIRIYDTNILEIKTVAGMINYKICKLLFEIKHPIDAIDQFRKHIDIFRIKTGPAELAFEHSAWLSKQFELMGEIFDEAIKKGFVSAIQTQHPGFYYHSAANHAIQRRQLRKHFAKTFFAREWTAENPSPCEGLHSLEFYGQRPWRQGQQGMEILDQQREKDAILFLQELETREDLTPLIIELYKQAITHFKIFNCKRMKQYLSVCMAEEYFYARKYQESLNIYIEVLNEYSNEHWWPIITAIMSSALKCAFLVADITNYCLLCTELIGKNILLSASEKASIQTNLLRVVVANEAPLVEAHQVDTEIHSVDEALAKWKLELLELTSHKYIPAEVGRMLPFVECKVRFASPIFNLSQMCELVVYMKTNCPVEISFNKLFVRFNLLNYNQFCVIEENLSFVPDKVREFRFRFAPQKQDIGKDLEVSQVGLELGTRDSRVLAMHWRGDCKNAMTVENSTIASFARLALSKTNQLVANPDKLDLNCISALPNTSLVARKANIALKLEHKMPIFLDEYYAIKLSIENLEENTIDNLTLSVEIQTQTSDASIEKKERVWIGEIDESEHKTQQSKVLENIAAKKQAIETIYVQMKQVASVNLVVRVEYQVGVTIQMVNNENSLCRFSDTPLAEKPSGADAPPPTHLVKCTCIQEKALKLDSIHPFKLDFSILSMQMRPVSVVHFGEPFLLLCEINNETPYSLKFNNSFLKTAASVRLKQNNACSFLKEETLKHHEKATECFCLVTKDDNEAVEGGGQRGALELGDFFVEWRRKTAETDHSDDEEERGGLNSKLFNVLTSIRLPEVIVEKFPFQLETELPAFGNLDQNLVLNYIIRNKTHTKILDFECSLEENEFFSLSGNKLEFLQVMPEDEAKFTLVIYPLQAGYCRLPKLCLKLNNLELKLSDETKQYINGSESNANEILDNNYLDSIIQNMLPSQIFIMPQNSF